MNRVRVQWMAACAVLLLLCQWLAAHPAALQDPRASVTLEIDAKDRVSVSYLTYSWKSLGANEMRGDAQIRAQRNNALPLVLQAELKLPRAVMLGTHKLEPDTYRIAVAMNDFGAFELVVLVDQVYERIPMDLSEGRQEFPYLCLSLARIDEGLFALVFQWGKELGRVVFLPASG